MMREGEGEGEGREKERKEKPFKTSLQVAFYPTVFLPIELSATKITPPYLRAKHL